LTVWEQITDTIGQDFSDLTDAGTAARVVFRLLLAAALGAALGYERETIGKAAGLRTHMLVALGAALFVLVPRETGADDAAISRVVQGLVAGIGFLGAGAIVKGRPGEEIQGLTTAACIWTTASLGMTVALGHAWTAIAAAALALVVLRVLPSSGPPGANHNNAATGVSKPPPPTAASDQQTTPSDRRP
jgi:putative Mg2+ transporter-C (MgtC) family protein